MLHCGAWVSLCVGFSCCGAQPGALGFSGFRMGGCFSACGNLPRSGIEPVPSTGTQILNPLHHQGDPRSSFSIVLSNDKTTVLVKDLLCRKPSPAPRQW